MTLFFCSRSCGSKNVVVVEVMYKDGVGQFGMFSEGEVGRKLSCRENDVVRRTKEFDQNNVIVKEFRCKYDCQKYVKISDRTLGKALDKNIMYNQHYFRKIGDKLSWIPNN